ncbi:Nicotinamide-nucleotide amidase [Saliniradius amylolyticus]|uniref:Nicotinamide-nucleotide amidase n=1 Tax=Saliniradius amylolyticus TaxID=2183582 RepID=A0A2S2E5L7_9ALTE|nr:CinA family protein [Saliniradius amylolyticus]AWL12530.1 Nicotinamide-nucleotide amidase [Saliniradius amylolyticus]
MTLTESIVDTATQLGAALKHQGWRISCAESCTGGGIGYAITSVSGSSQWFERGFITYSNEAKIGELGVDESILLTSGAVSSETVDAMAKGAQRRADAEVAVAVSGIAGPDGGTPEKPVGLVWFALAVCEKTITWSRRFDGDRHQVRQQAIQDALTTTLAYLNKN